MWGKCIRILNNLFDNCAINLINSNYKCVINMIKMKGNSNMKQATVFLMAFVLVIGFVGAMDWCTVQQQELVVSR